jgi:hypothetical protein
LESRQLIPFTSTTLYQALQQQLKKSDALFEHGSHARFLARSSLFQI